jgi:glycosyltransferase involved in cell wall biosynthesis
MNKPKVTIITVTKNRGVLLKRAIISVLSQTFQDIEYLIIDGASTDNTAEIVNSFSDERIKYFKLKEDFDPMVLCHEYAINLSSGEYITFLDDDDEYLPTKIERQYDLLTSLPEEYGMVYCWMDYYDEESGKLLKEHHPANRGNIFHECIEKQSMGGTPTLFLRRDVYYKVNGFNKFLKHSSDWEFNTRVAREYLVDFVPEVLVTVHINHPFLRMSQAAAKKTRKNVVNHIEFIEYYLTEFKEGFLKYPQKKFGHLITLAKCYAKIGDSKKCRNVIMQLIHEFGFRIKILETILKSSYYFSLKNFK